MEVSYVRLEGMRQATSSHLRNAVNEGLAFANRTVERDQEGRASAKGSSSISAFL